MEQRSAHCQDQASTYRIRVEGRLSERWAKRMGAMVVAAQTADTGQPTTILLGTVVDQAALRGILCQLWDLKLVLISVVRVERREGDARAQCGD